MANVRSGNSWYIDSTGDLGGTTSYQAVNVFTIIVTKTSGTDSQLLLTDKSTNATKVDIRRTSDDTAIIDFETRPLYFAGGVNVGSISNCVATIIVEDRGA